MSLLFIHGEKVKKDNQGNFYTGGSYNNEVWERYLAVFDSVTFIGRQDPHIYEESEARKKFNLINNNIKFIPIKNTLSSISGFFNKKNQKYNYELIYNEVLKNEYLIARVPSVFSNTAIEIAKKNNKKYMVEVVGCPWGTLNNHSLKGKIIAPFSTLSMKRNVYNADYALYVTEDFLQKRYPTKGKEIAASDVAITPTSDKIFKKRLEKITNKKSNKIILGTAAGIDVKYKNQSSVIKSLYRLKKEGFTNYEYLIVGSGDSTYLSKLINKLDMTKNIQIIGEVKHNEMNEWYDKLDVYIQPSKQEGLPRSVVEAMSRGLLVMGSNVGGIPELIGKEFIFESNDTKQIVNLLKNVNESILLEQAKKNFMKSKDFNPNKLNKKRDSFLINYKLSKDV